MKNRGQIQISFGMIFSIIIIIATVGIAIYFIQQFLSTGECVDIQLFYDDVKKEVDSVWRSPIAKDPYTARLPGDITAVCFGNLSSSLPVEYQNLARYASTGSTVFLYPSKNACDGQGAHGKIDHIDMSRAVCAPVVDGKISVIFSKGSSSDKYVKVEINE